MSRKIAVVALVMFACLVSVATAKDSKEDFSTWHESHDKVSPIWTLPKAMAPANMVWDKPSMPGDLEADDFFTPDVCAGCHEEIYNQWKGSMMGNAWSDPVFRAVYKAYLKKSKTGHEQEETAMCSKCHTPVGYLANEMGRYFSRRSL